MVLCLLSLVATQGIGSSKPAVHYLTIKGSRSGAVRIDVPRDLRVDWAGIKYKTSGTYAAWIIGSRVEVNGLRYTFPESGGLHVPAMDKADEADHLPAMTFAGRRVPAGTYTLLLATDGPTTIRIPIQGLKSDLVLRPKSSLKTQAALQNLAPAATPVMGHAEVPIELRKTSLRFVVIFNSTKTYISSVKSFCITPRSRPGCVDDGPGGVLQPDSANWWSVGHTSQPGQGSWSRYLFWTAIGYPGPGKFNVIYDMVRASEGGTALALTLVIDV